MNKPARITVTAAEFTRQFGHLRQSLGDSPVFVTHHGRETHVLLSKLRYEDLRNGAGGEGDRPAIAFEPLAEALPQGVMIIDPGHRVVVANRPAHAMLAREVGSLVNCDLMTVVPELRSSPVAGYILRAIESGERQRADLPSPTRPGRWLQLDVHPVARFTVILLHDITDEVKQFRLADRDRAAAEAMRLHPAIGEMCLSVRGQIESANAVVADWLALGEDRVRGVALTDLVPTRGRPALREALDSVLRGRGPVAIDCDLLNNRGETVAVHATIIELRGVYASEGALVVLTRACEEG